MPIRWFVCPVVTEAHPDGGFIRYPKLARTPQSDGTAYQFSAAVQDGIDWALCFVRAPDFTTLTSDAQQVGVFEAMEYEDTDSRLAQTPRDLGWNAARVTRLRQKLTARGVDSTGLTIDTPLWQWLERIGQAITPNFHPIGTWVG